MARNKFNFAEIKERVTKMKNVLPPVLANQAKNYFVGNFSNQSFDGQKWQEVNRRIPGTSAYKYPKKKDLGRRRRPILIGKGSTKLRRATANSIRVQKWPIVRLVVDLPYARIHNEGLRGRAFGKYGFTMPKRQYIGQTKKLTDMQLKKVKSYSRKIWHT